MKNASYSQLLGGMMQQILAHDSSAAPALFLDKKDFPPKEQLSIYTEGYRLRLYDVLQGAYPALLHYLGETAFHKLSLEFIEAHPSTYFNIDKYPIAFGAYVEQHAQDVFAGELALLESAISDVYQREESAALTMQWLAQQTPQSLITAPLALRTASILIQSEYPLLAYYTAFRADEKPAKPEPQPSYAMILRHKHQVQRLSLTAAEFTLLFLLAEGKTVEQIFEDERFMPCINPETVAQDFHQWFARFIQEGMLCQA